VERIPFDATKFGTTFTDFVLAVTSSTTTVDQKHPVESVRDTITLKRVRVSSAENPRLIVLCVSKMIACSRNGAAGENTISKRMRTNHHIVLNIVVHFITVCMMDQLSDTAVRVETNRDLTAQTEKHTHPSSM
jgi:hypothetical protein